MGELIYHSLQNITRVPHGYASVRNVATGELEDRMTSFFLAETCKCAASIAHRSLLRLAPKF